jgi:putative methionine-R-sulfoxide reductase with GAF domain
MKTIKLKQQIILLITLSLLLPSLVITGVALYKIRSKALADIEQFREDEMTKLKLYLKHITDIGYGMIDVKHKQLKDSLSSLGLRDTARVYKKVQSSILQQCLDDLSGIRFDKGEGYFWVTDNREPFPKMLMHAEKPELTGVVLDDAKYNVEKDQGRNIYQVRAQMCNQSGEAYVAYIMKKPGTDQVENKISYSRLYGPLNWVISTGFYTDQIDQAVGEKKEALSGQITEVTFYIIAIALSILVGGLMVSFHFSKRLTDAILLIRDKLKMLATGNQVEEISVTRKDEVGEMTHSLNFLVEGLERYTSFAKKIGQGNLDETFQPLSEEDVLGNELLQMRDGLKKAAHDKNLRDWANEGYALLGEVLRKNNTDTAVLADEVLKALVNYLQVNQGSLYVLTDEDSHKQGVLELMATYAYNKKKFEQNRIALGEGLAGQAVLERSTIHLREVPEKYVRITSGLGDALPRTVIIVPLIQNDMAYGVIELASFNTFEPYHVHFIEKIAENVASTISTVRTNEKTRRLLEQSQQMSEELKAQEEELRQNQEELQATQEQMRRRQLELEKENELLKKHHTNGHERERISETELAGAL